MKKIVALTLFICIMLTACSRTPNEGKEEKVSTEQVNKEKLEKDKITDGITDKTADKVDDTNIEPTELTTLNLNKEWSGKITTGKKIPELIIPTFEAKVEPYTILKDLTNIENIGQFSGFTKEQMNMLSENGFVVLPTTNTKMYYVY
ncbi:MAG TPA: hypothetical protein VJZ06_07690, partial [Mobilitalea sp.]|nr:hypothetical protein [Mobilitalea sp.]